MNHTDWKLLKEIAELEKTPQGAYNIRRNGQLDSRASTANIEITTKTEPDKPGIDIRIKSGTRNESVHIPVIITQTGMSEMVYNDFFIGEDCDVDIVAGCGIHNAGSQKSQHDGVHTFYVGKRSKVRYVERHYGEGEGTGERIMTVSYTHLDVYKRQVSACCSSYGTARRGCGRGCASSAATAWRSAPRGPSACRGMTKGNLWNMTRPALNSPRKI